MAVATGGRTPLMFAWDFGDGSTGSGIQGTHTYSSAGPFLVVLKVTDASGAVAMVSGWTGVIPSSSLLVDFSFVYPVIQGCPVVFVYHVICSNVAVIIYMHN